GFRPAMVTKMVDPRMLEKAPDNRTYPDVLGQPWNSGLETTNATDDQVHLDPGLGGAIECLHQIRIGQCVDLENDPPPGSVARLAIHQLDQAAMQGERGVEQLLDLERLAHPGELLEQLVDVIPQGIVAGQ